MKCTVPEISWHNRDPVLSVDFQYHNGSLRRLATGGTDCHVLIWYVEIAESGGVKLEFAADLMRHNKAVNIVRFSPNGEMLASADDEAAIWIWKQAETDAPDIFVDEAEKENKESWVPLRPLRGHIEDVYDLCWSPNSSMMISGSVDNTAILWDVQKGRNMGILSDHKGFVQGVAWDPQNQFVASLCSDRFCRIYNINTKRAVFKIHKLTLPSEGDQPPKQHRMFHDDTLKSFCRRLTFTPDGELLITPAGCIELDDDKKLNVTYVFCRNNFTKPALYLPTKDKYTVAVRCCPVLFELRPLLKADAAEKEHPWEKYSTMFCLPYRIVFAVATQDSVFFYDTQQPTPFAHVSKIHYTRLSDLTWSQDGRILVISSTDGYCSIVTFGEEEIGIPYKGLSKKPEKTDATATEEQCQPEMGLNDKKTPANTSTTSTPKAKPIQIRSAKNSDKNRKIQLITLSGPRTAGSTSQKTADPVEEAKKNLEPSKMKTETNEVVEDIKNMEIDDCKVKKLPKSENTTAEKQICDKNQSVESESKNKLEVFKKDSESSKEENLLMETENLVSSVKEIKGKTELNISVSNNKESVIEEITLMDIDEAKNSDKNASMDATADKSDLIEETSDLNLVLELSNDEQTIQASLKDKEVDSLTNTATATSSPDTSKKVSLGTNKAKGRRVDFITLSSPKQDKKKGNRKTN